MSHLTITGNITADPELRFSQSGNGWTTFTVAENRKEGDREATTFQRCKAFSGKSGAMAENIAESITKGTRVIVAGRIVTERWESNGEPRSENVLIVDSFGPDLRWATARVSRNERSSNENQSPQGFASAAGVSANDPWATPPSNDEPPF